MIKKFFHLVQSGVYISVRKQYLFPPPFWKLYFFPLSRHVVFWLPSLPFCLNSSLLCNYFTLLLPLLSFSFPFLPFSSPFLPFSFTFSPFFFSPFHIFSPKWHRLIFPPPPGGGGGGIFQYIGSWVQSNFLVLCGNFVEKGNFKTDSQTWVDCFINPLDPGQLNF